MSQNIRRRLIGLGAVVLLVMSAACGGSRSSPNGDSADAGVGGDATAPAPTGARVAVSLTPNRYLYPTQLPITASATVYNSNDEVVEDAEVTWSVSPSAAVNSIGENKFAATAEGEFTFEACRIKDGSPTNLCGSKTIVVDDGNPQLQLTKPKGGGFYGMDGEETVQVAGRVTNARGDPRVFVNGDQVDLGDDGSFSYEYDPRFGVNHISVRANDVLHDKDVTAARDIMFAPYYRSISTGTNQIVFDADEGLSLQLGQNFFDDTKPPTTNESGSEIITNDMADIAELLIQNIDLASQIPNPALDTSGITLEVPGVQVGSPQVAIDITDSGLDMYLFAQNVTVSTAGELKFQGQSLDLTGTVDAQLSAVVAMELKKPASTVPFEASITDLFVSLDRVESNFSDSQADALFALAESTLRSKLESLVTTEIEQRFLEQIPTLITDALNSVNSAISEQTFSFDNALIGSRTLALNGEVSTFSTTYRDAVRVGIDGTGTTTGTPIHPDAPGVPLTTAPETPVPMFDQSRLQLGIDLGVLNGALYTLWKANFLKLDVTERLPESVRSLAQSGSLNAQLPPVLVPADGASDYDLMLRIGQVEVEAQLLDQTDRVAANLEVGINVTFDESQLQLELADEPTINAWLIETTGDSAILSEELFRTAFRTKIWPQVSSAIEGGLKIDVPLPSLTSISDIAPTLSNLQLDLVQARPLDVRRGFLMLDSKLEGRLSLGE